jgi:two-component system chemotaxis sensor kinase CheA
VNEDRRQDLDEIFRDEVRERLDRTVEILLGAERDDPSPETIRSLFREMHSIKGGAGMFGADAVYAVADAIEDVLADARAAGRLAPALIDPLLKAADALRRIVEGAPADGDPVAALAAAARGVGPAGPADSAPVTPAISPPDAPAARSEAPVAPRAAATGGRHSVRIDVEKVDRLVDAVGATALHQRRLERSRLGDRSAAAPGDDADGVEDGDVILDELQDAVIALRMLPLESITAPFPRLVRDMAADLGKEAELVIVGADAQMDRVVLDSVAEAIGHLLRNAVAHGIESPAERADAGKPRRGRIELSARELGHEIIIAVEDDGRGVAAELLRQASSGRSLADLLSHAGLSTASAVTAASGRGVGMDAVRHHVETLGGELEVRSEPGRGTRVSLGLPVSLALPHVLLVRRAGSSFGIPLTAVSEVIVVEEPLRLGDRLGVEVRGAQLPLVDLLSVLRGSGPAPPPRAPAVVVHAGGARVALLCDDIRGDDHALVKPLGPLLAPVVSGYVGGAVMPDGDIVLILDVPRLVSAAEDQRGAVPVASAGSAVAEAPNILVVDDQFTVRELQRSILEAAGYRVETARDGRAAWDLLRAGTPVDLVLTDIEMPELDGLGLAAEIRGNTETASLPIVMVTSRGSDEDRRRGLDAGADAYIVKEGFDQRGLLDTVRRLVRP